MTHDFTAFPELTDEQMNFYYFDSPHKQIFESFRAQVIKVHDGDTITLRWFERDFDFPVRFSDIAAPELSEAGGEDSKNWLERKLLNEEVDVSIDPKNRVEKWGRLLGKIYFNGISIGDESINAGKSISWENRNDGKIKSIEGELKKVWV